jgi:ATP-dependent DNA helicase RecG
VSNPEWVQQELARICREEIVPPIVPFFDCIAFDNGRRVVVLDVEGKKKPYRTRDGRFYMRFGAEKREVTREELSVWLDEMRPLGYENIPLTDAEEADFDDGLLWGFANAFEDNVIGNHLYQTGDFLRRDLLLAVGTVDDFLPTVAAVVLFGKNERVAELLPRSAMTVARFSGANGSAQLIEKIELKGNLLTIYESALRFAQRYCDLGKERPKRPPLREVDSPVQWRAHYHIYSVREGIANALMHRDLALRDNSTRMNIYDNSIEIINPRRTNNFATASRAIRYGITQRLNPQIAAIFSRREYGSSVPKGGLPMILRQSHKFSGKRPEIYVANDEFKLKIYGV